jgi:hypothetical protein
MEKKVHKRASVIFAVIIAFVLIITIKMVLSSDNAVNLKLHILGSGVDIETKK